MFGSNVRAAFELWSIQFVDHFMSKFLRDVDRWIDDARARAARLGLSQAEPMRILDIGCGVPYFLAACRELGHEVAGLDVPDLLISSTTSAMGGDRPFELIEHVIRRDAGLPPLGGPFDLITMFGVNLRDDGVWWEWDDWCHLIRNLLSALDSIGSLIIQPNKGPHCSELVLDEARWKQEQLPAAVRVQDLWLIFSKG